MVIPVHDINPVRRTPWVTYALIIANFIVFLMTPGVTTLSGSISLADMCHQQAFFDQWAAIPHELVTNRQLPLVPNGHIGFSVQGPGCLVGPPTYHKIAVLSAFSAMFLHGSWLHILGNMLFLWIFGNNIEDRFGRVRYLLFYLFCGLVASYGFALANSDSTETLIGASGAIAGVLGAYLVLYPRARVWSLVPFFFFIPLRLPAWFVLGLWFVLQWAYSAGYATSGAASVAYLAHVFGFLAGVVIGVLVHYSQRRPVPRTYPPW
jgi:membrane associated rhomboid family serine protease